MPRRQKQSDFWSAEDKLAIVIKTAGLSEAELSAFVVTKACLPSRSNSGEAIACRALAETRALLVLSKKVKALYGDEPRLTPQSERIKLLRYFKEAIDGGASRRLAAQVMNLSQRTLKRWANNLAPDKRPAAINKQQTTNNKPLWPCPGMSTGYADTSFTWMISTSSTLKRTTQH